MTHQTLDERIHQVIKPFAQKYKLYVADGEYFESDAWLDVEKTMRTLVSEVLDDICNYCKEYIASGDCDCGGYNQAIDDIKSTIQILKQDI